MTITNPEPILHPPATAVREPGPIIGERLTRRAVSTVLAVIALLTFTFSFGNVWALGLRLSVPTWIAPLIGPAVDLSVAGLLIAVRHLALNGATPDQLREARLLVVFSGVVCLALNVAEPVIDHAYGRAAFDAVSPMLLLGWAQVGPTLLRHIHALRQPPCPAPADTPGAPAAADVVTAPPSTSADRRRSALAGRTIGADLSRRERPRTEQSPGGRRTIRISAQVLAEARRIDREHRAAHDRPASAATLRSRLHIGGPESNHLVKIVRGRLPDPTKKPATRRIA